MGTGFGWVKILIPVPVPVTKPTLNPQVYPYPCYSLGAHHLCSLVFIICTLNSCLGLPVLVWAWFGLGQGSCVGLVLAGIPIAVWCSSLRHHYFCADANLVLEIEIFQISRILTIPLEDCFLRSIQCVSAWLGNNQGFS